MIVLVYGCATLMTLKLLVEFTLDRSWYENMN